MRSAARSRITRIHHPRITQITRTQKGIYKYISVVFVALLSFACAARGLTLPTGAGTPLADFEERFSQATASCRETRTLTAQIGLSGRVGSARLRARLLAGMANPNALRLEAVAPFGAPAFVLTAREGNATLYMPREDHVVTATRASDLLEALAGVALEPDEVRTLASGCLFPTLLPTGGTAYPNGWSRIDLEGGRSAYLQNEQLVAGRSDRLSIEYQNIQHGLPRVVRVRSTPGGSSDTRPRIDLTLQVSEPQINTALSEDAFTQKIPPTAMPITLEELRRRGPLGER